MKYFKNTELAKLYHVSEKSVRNWIQAAQTGKLDLKLHEENGRLYIANTSENTRNIERLAEKGKKYKNSRGYKVISPKKEFYQKYTNEQIREIILSLTVHRESPLQYGYVGSGAQDWDEYTWRLSEDKNSNLLNSSTQLLKVAGDHLNTLTSDYKNVNILDLGPGNGMPAKPMLEKLKQENRLGRYIAIDISKDMLSILEKNLKKWFGDSINYETHLHDVSSGRFGDLLAEDFVSGESANIVFLFGGTLANLHDPEHALQVINQSLNPDDLLIYNGYLDTPQTRRHFDYYTSDKKVPVQDGLILDFLNVDDSLYDVEMSFDEKQRARTISVRPVVDISIVFEFENGTRTMELHRDEPILLWRHRHYNTLDLIKLFDSNGFEMQQLTKSKDQNYFLLVSKLKRSNQS